MTIEDGMDGAFGWQAQIAGESAQEELPDFAGAPMWLVALEALDLAGELDPKAASSTVNV